VACTSLSAGRIPFSLSAGRWHYHLVFVLDCEDLDIGEWLREGLGTTGYGELFAAVGFPALAQRLS
ncbi:hypothetical protein HAX54_040720, partial [Datura stramonium]|nr:hypothetical protein [Datura stramonium]